MKEKKKNPKPYEMWLFNCNADVRTLSATPPLSLSSKFVSNIVARHLLPVPINKSRSMQEQPHACAGTRARIWQTMASCRACVGTMQQQPRALHLQHRRWQAEEENRTDLRFWRVAQDKARVLATFWAAA